MTKSAVLKFDSEIVTHCGKCKLDLAHNVIAKMPDSDTPAKVQCRTCGSIHKYKLPKALKPKKTPSRSKAKKSSKNSNVKIVRNAEDHAQYFQEVAHKYRDSRLVPYAMNASFKTGDRVDHPTFGLGVVLSLLDSQKMEVVFSTQVKILVYDVQD